MDNQKTQIILNTLGTAISERKVNEVAISLRDFILTYLLNTLNSKDIDSKKSALEDEFGLTSGLREVQFPRKNSPRETELRIFSELKLNLGVVRCNRTKLFKPC